MNIIRLFAVASAAFFIAGTASAQNAGTVTNNAFAIGNGPGQAGYRSLLCGAAQLAVGQSAAAPICRTVTGDVTIDATGVTAIGTAKITTAMLATVNGNVGSFGSASAIPSLTVNAKGQVTAASSSAYQDGTNAAKGVVRGDGSTINCVSGVCTAVGAAATSIAVGTTTITGGSNGQMLYNNGGVLGSKDTISVVKTQTFTSSGTYTPSTGMVYAVVEVVGGGGGGGGGAATGAGTFAVGGGGGGGGYARSVISAATIGASQTVTRGAGGTGVVNSAGNTGGTSSFGALVVASGGVGGALGPATANTAASGGAGGIGTTGSILIQGSPGGASIGVFGNIANAGAGGSSAGIGSGGATTATLAGTGVSATGFGGGGAGASLTQSSAAVAGGNGANGIIIVTEFCTQ